MRLVSLKKFADQEFLVVAAGGIAMLLVVVIFDMCGLLP